jgi:hypothetical protein
MGLKPPRNPLPTLIEWMIVLAVVLSIYACQEMTARRTVEADEILDVRIP